MRKKPQQTRESVAGKRLSDFPNIALEWDVEANGGRLPADVPAGTSLIGKWACRKGHKWEAAVANRTSANTSCASCTGRKVSDDNNLLVKFPAIAAEWHPTKNNGRLPQDVVPGSQELAYWQCSAGHEWQDHIIDRTRSKKGAPCRKCHSLATLYPHLMDEWDNETNQAFDPYAMAPHTAIKVGWSCRLCGLKWSASIQGRTNKRHPNGCPVCGHRSPTPDASQGLAASFPIIAQEWHPSRNGSLKAVDVWPFSMRSVWWKCQKCFNEWEMTVAKRTKSQQGCPSCYSNTRWGRPRIKALLETIIKHDLVHAMKPSELMTLMAMDGLLNSKNGSRITDKLIKGIQKKDPSAIKQVHDDIDKMEDDPQSVEDDSQSKSGGLDKTLASGDDGEVDPLVEEEDEEDELPNLRVPRILMGMDILVAKTIDKQADKFLIESGKGSLWGLAFNDEAATLDAVRKCKNKKSLKGVDKEYKIARSVTVRTEFLTEYKAVRELKLPKDYTFHIEPNLMQRLAAYRVKRDRRVGNWSGTGAGKTLAAILASGLIKAGFTIIVCPNNTVEQWKKEILLAFPKALVETKNIGYVWAATKRRRYLILNHETFQQQGVEAAIMALLSRDKIDFIVIDEVQAVKQRYADEESMRRKMLNLLVQEAGKKNKKLHVLGMSATPVINNLQEAKSLIELILGEEQKGIETRPTRLNALAVHQRLTMLGFRYKPKYKLAQDVKVIELDCSHLQEALCAAKGKPHEIEKLLFDLRLPTIVANVVPKTLIYSQPREDIVKPIIDELRRNKWNAAEFSGEDKVNLDDFINGNVDVVVGTDAIATGVDGLQKVCNRLIFASLPWTAAQYEQIIGRLFRQGQVSENVEIFIIITKLPLGDGTDWSWDQMKQNRINYKSDLASAAVDGYIPNKELATPEKAARAAIQRLIDAMSIAAK
jgi:hypothetical protein